MTNCVTVEKCMQAKYTACSRKVFIILSIPGINCLRASCLPVAIEKENGDWTEESEVCCG